MVLDLANMAFDREGEAPAEPRETLDIVWHAPSNRVPSGLQPPVMLVGLTIPDQARHGVKNGDLIKPEFGPNDG